MSENIHRVVRVEQHWLPTCPCEECLEERKRRRAVESSPANDHIMLLRPEVAFAMGLTPKFNPAGSIAKLLSLSQGLQARPGPVA